MLSAECVWCHDIIDASRRRDMPDAVLSQLPTVFRRTLIVVRVVVIQYIIQSERHMSGWSDNVVEYNQVLLKLAITSLPLRRTTYITAAKRKFLTIIIADDSKLLCLYFADNDLTQNYSASCCRRNNFITLSEERFHWTKPCNHTADTEQTSEVPLRVACVVFSRSHMVAIYPTKRIFRSRSTTNSNH